ncbi:uncharacterized protein LOC114297547 [Camellia sinensis]|uniref:uncharacterized protein LOC114297547 n=1 Tax=Camellia sinensis TaxID=4442 RepID=UPI001035D425|nr:uncharacterized protein LOC114297547 [Camellia sinensis]
MVVNLDNGDGGGSSVAEDDLGSLNLERANQSPIALFRPNNYEDPLEALTHLKQTSTIAIYQEAFKMLSHQVAYLGHLISFVGVAVDLEKINSVLKCPTLTSTRGVRDFLGLVRYYQKFNSGFGEIAAPLTRLLSKDGFQWTSEAATSVL